MIENACFVARFQHKTRIFSFIIEEKNLQYGGIGDGKI